MSQYNRGYNQMGGGAYNNGANPYAQQDDYDPNGYNGGGYGRQGDVEMQPFNQGYAGGGGGGSDAILNSCRDIDRELQQLNEQLDQLDRLYKRAANAPDQFGREIDQMSSTIMSGYRALVDRVKKIKSQPESQTARNSGQVGRIDRSLKQTIQRYQSMEREYRRDMQQQAERQYRIVKPDASPEEIREATENPEAPIFQQALMQSDRRGQATSVLNNVRARHEEIQKIERQMTELAELFQDLDRIVMEQDEVIHNIETKAEETGTNVVAANEQIDTAIDLAKARQRKKWWCVLIVVLIIIAIAIIIGVVVAVLKK
ncbi:t-SNARE [Pseudovirgaria hyperparasitica]|uniref:t-SNARE n=1 Tax=Pseudovirgaria hyperparasitica TaxID=470096 RepID=A0A6A6VYX7_9PEZI|nr:t-SNARE [Pseudovirgaria hyperparasitica]KAF2755079.1 t-SNARE [Pseudovirgaria hyperparasitica]